MDTNSIDDGYYELIRNCKRGDAEYKRIWGEIDAKMRALPLYDGMSDVFDYLRKNNIPSVLVTGAVKRRYEIAIKKYKIPFGGYVGRFDSRKRKPNPEPIQKGIEILGCNKDDILSIGNQIIDMEASHAAGVKFAACAWGAIENEKEELYRRADFILKSPRELITLLTDSAMTKKSQGSNQRNLIENIQSLMTQRGYTQSSLAREMGKQPVVINRALNGKVPISPKMQMEIAQLFDISVEELNGNITIPAAKRVQGFIKFNNGKTRDISSLKDLKVVYEDIVYQIEKRPKEIEQLIAECQAQEAKVKALPHDWKGIDLFKKEEYNPREVYCWTFRKADEEKENVINSLGNMCSGFPFSINGHTFQGSEQAYIAGLFSEDTKECIAIQKALIKEGNGYAAKKTIRNRNERKCGRRDWEEFNVQWMLYVVWQKCIQNKEFAKLLKKVPRNAIIIENSALQKGETADFWGCKNEEWEVAFKTIKENADIVCSGKTAAAVQDRIVKDGNAITCVGTYKGVNCMGKILTICRDCLLDKTEPQIDYDLLKNKQIYILGELMKFDK